MGILSSVSAAGRHPAAGLPIANTRKPIFSSAARGVRVNAVAPGFLETDLSASLSPENRDRIARRTALGRLGTPGDVVSAIDFLTSPAAAFITAQVFAVDGGT